MKKLMGEVIRIAKKNGQKIVIFFAQISPSFLMTNYGSFDIPGAFSGCQLSKEHEDSVPHRWYGRARGRCGSTLQEVQRHPAG